MSDWNATPRSVVALYQQLAAERAGAARAALARERSLEGLSRTAPPRSRMPRARCCTPPQRSSRFDGPLPRLLAEQAGALLAVAARFEEAADLTRTQSQRDRTEEP
ncbi:MAG: hypothetical protein ACXVWT_19490 [Solirubrobacteraceae bacterium]